MAPQLICCRQLTTNLAKSFARSPRPAATLRLLRVTSEPRSWRPLASKATATTNSTGDIETGGRGRSTEDDILGGGRGDEVRQVLDGLTANERQRLQEVLHDDIETVVEGKTVDEIAAECDRMDADELAKLESKLEILIAEADLDGRAPPPPPKHPQSLSSPISHSAAANTTDEDHGPAIRMSNLGDLNQPMTTASAEDPATAVQAATSISASSEPRDGGGRQDEQQGERGVEGGPKPNGSNFASRRDGMDTGGGSAGGGFLNWMANQPPKTLIGWAWGVFGIAGVGGWALARVLSDTLPPSEVAADASK